MLQKLSKHITQNLSFLKGKKLFIACSGGVDSVVLARLFFKMEFDVSLAHCNFSLRGKESDGDEDFVVDLAKKLSIPVFTETFDTKLYAAEHKLSTQMAARELRYRWFYELIDTLKFDYVLTAHHLDDELETFLINLSRGTGLKGLSGIPQINEKTVRPLLDFSKEEILNYARENNLAWREDGSNATADYLRNQLRLEVIPKFRETNENLLQNFQKTRSHLTASQNLVDDYLVLVYELVVSEVENGYRLNIKKLRELPNTEALLYELLSPFGFSAWEDISALLTAQSGKQVFSKTHRLLKDRDVLILTEIPILNNEEIFISEETKNLNFPFPLIFETVEYIGETEKNIVYMDKQLLSYPLLLRKWKAGDTFQPIGMKGKKKLSKFFKDEKLTLNEKENSWVLCSDGQVVWVVGLRADDNFKVTEKTKLILKVSVKK